MSLRLGLLMCIFALVAPPVWAKGKAPEGKAFMEVYSNMYRVPIEDDFVGYQASVLHVIYDSGEEVRILWQQGAVLCLPPSC